MLLKSYYLYFAWQVYWSSQICRMRSPFFINFFYYITLFVCLLLYMTDTLFLIIFLFSLILSLITILQNCQEVRSVKYCVWKKKLSSSRRTGFSCRHCLAASSAGGFQTTAVSLETIPQTRYACMIIWVTINAFCVSCLAVSCF